MIHKFKKPAYVYLKIKIMFRYSLLAIILFCKILNCFSQVPTTDIYLLDMKVKHGKYVFANPQKISDWKGYNNQPYFTPDGKTIYYVSYRNKQSDIYKYDIESKTTTQFTNTPEDEYSPKLTPDEKYISVVRVMKDSAQQMWEFPVDGSAPVHLFTGFDSIGYYCWSDSGILIANVPEPMKLIISWYSTLTLGKWPGYLDMKLKNVGRAMAVTSGRRPEFIFVLKGKDKKDSIFEVCRIDGRKFPYKIVPVVNTLPKCEDFALGPKNTLLMGKNGRLYKYRIGRDKEWKEIADFFGTEYKNFYRITISADGKKIALVSYQGKKP